MAINGNVVCKFKFCLSIEILSIKSNFVYKLKLCLWCVPHIGIIPPAENGFDFEERWIGMKYINGQAVYDDGTPVSFEVPPGDAEGYCYTYFFGLKRFASRDCESKIMNMVCESFQYKSGFKF